MRYKPACLVLCLAPAYPLLAIHVAQQWVHFRCCCPAQYTCNILLYQPCRFPCLVIIVLESQCAVPTMQVSPPLALLTAQPSTHQQSPDSSCSALTPRCTLKKPSSPQ
jgi:hypothetical protein